MKLLAHCVAASLLFAATRIVPALAAPKAVVTYEIDLIGTDNIPNEAYDDVFSNPEKSFRPILATFPDVFFTGPGQPIVDPNGGNRSLLRGSAHGEHDRSLQIRICSTRCLSVVVPNGSVRRELFEARLSPTVVTSLQTVLSAKLTRRMCGKTPGCDVKVVFTQIY
jgi:hypothetical protein